MVSACGFTPMYQSGMMDKVSVYLLEVTGDNATAIKRQLSETVTYSDTARLSLSVVVKEIVFEENIDQNRYGARETVRTTVTYTIYDRETNTSSTGSFTEQKSYTMADSEISSRLEQTNARFSISENIIGRVQTKLLDAEKSK